MKTKTHSTKSESRRDFEVFRQRLLAELQITRIVSTLRPMNCRWNQTPTMGAYREVTMGKLERDLQTDVETEEARNVRWLSIAHPGRSPGSDTLTRTCIKCGQRTQQLFRSARQADPNPAH